MILNSFAILTVFVALLRLPMAIVVLAVAVVGWRRARAAAQATERGHLALLLAVTLVLLSLVSWPLLYLLLQSYVPEWPGVMCIYGVTQVGRDSLGAARHLPTLVTVMQLLKPVLVFAGGAWYVLHLLNRQTQTAPLSGRVFAALVPLGLLAVADGAADLVYVAIPKKEEIPSAGCCTVADVSPAARFLPPVLLGEGGRPWLYAAYYATNLVVLAALSTCIVGSHLRPSMLTAVAAVGLVDLAVSGVFLVDVVSPTLLRRPFHHCAYDLVPEAPEGMVGIGLFLGGTFALGWAVAASWLGRAAETRTILPGLVRHLLSFSLWGYLTSLLMISMGLLLA